MQTSQRKSRPLFCILALLILTGCMTRDTSHGETTTQAPLPGVNTNQALALIAADFVNAMRQIPSLLPATTTVQLLRSQSDDELIKAFRGALVRTGYGVRWVHEPSGKVLLQYRQETTNESDTFDQLRFDIAVGNIELRRSYTDVVSNQVQPVTPLYVRGADATQVVLDDSDLFTVKSIQAVESAPLTLPESVSPLSGLLSNVDAANSLTVAGLVSSQAQNVLDLGGSNFAHALSEYDILFEQVLTFPNDSLRMGNTNKKLVDVLVTRFNPATDIFSVLGCSIGPTNLKNGNAALALGRASRVREALLFAGVDRNKIFDEGCWAGDSSGTTLPGRGVVLTLNRKIR